MAKEQIYLAELREGDSELLTQWQWDEEFAVGISYDVFHPFQNKDWEAMFDTSDSEEKFYYTIRKKNDDSLIGFISLSEVLLKNRRGELGIGIPAKENRGRGYGSEAITCLLHFAFDHLGLHKVNLSVNANNSQAIHVYESLGFHREGVNREANYQAGKWLDIYDYGLLESEWRAH